MSNTAKFVIGALLVGYLALAGFVWVTNKSHEERELSDIKAAAKVVIAQQKEEKPESQVRPDYQATPLFNNWFGRDEPPVIKAAEVPAAPAAVAPAPTPVEPANELPAPVQVSEQKPIKKAAEATKRVVNKGIDGVASAVQSGVDFVKSAKCTGDQEWKGNKECGWVRETWGGKIGPYERIDGTTQYDRD